MRISPPSPPAKVAELMTALSKTRSVALRDTSPASPSPLTVEPMKAPPARRRWSAVSRTEPGCLRFDVLQHTQRANHFTIVEAWRTRAARDRHVAAMHTRQYREALQPMIGSPLDERLMRLP